MADLSHKQVLPSSNLGLATNNPDMPWSAVALNGPLRLSVQFARTPGYLIGERM